MVYIIMNISILSLHVFFPAYSIIYIVGKYCLMDALSAML